MRGASGDETGTRDAMAAVDRPRHVSGRICALAPQSLALSDHAARPNRRPVAALTDGSRARGRLRPRFFSPAIARRLSAGHLTIFDAQAPMLDMARRRVAKQRLTNFTSVCGSGNGLPFADAVFDVVFMITVLGEIPDGAAAIREAARVLRSGGRFSATEAAGDPDRVKQTDWTSSPHLQGSRKAKAGRAYWSGPSTTKSQSRWRRELEKSAGGKIKKLAGFGAARQTQRQDFFGHRLGCRQRYRIFSGHDLRPHAGPRRSWIE
jgi:SAM-dependent methyltransferase